MAVYVQVNTLRCYDLYKSANDVTCWTCRTSQIIFATMFERIYFHTTPPPLSIVGTVIIMTSAIYVAVRSLFGDGGFEDVC